MCSVSLDCRLISAFETSSFPKCGQFLKFTPACLLCCNGEGWNPPVQTLLVISAGVFPFLLHVASHLEDCVASVTQLLILTSSVWNQMLNCLPLGCVCERVFVFEQKGWKQSKPACLLYIPSPSCHPSRHPWLHTPCYVH